MRYLIARNNASKLFTDGHDWFFPRSNSVSVQRVFIKIERIINKITKREKKNIQKALISSNMFPNNKYVVSSEKKNTHTHTTSPFSQAEKKVNQRSNMNVCVLTLNECRLDL